MLLFIRIMDTINSSDWKESLISLDKLIRLIVQANWKRISETIEYTTWPVDIFKRTFDNFRLTNPWKFRFIQSQWIIIDLWNGMFRPKPIDMKELWFHTYIWIDFYHKTDTDVIKDWIRYIMKKWDFFWILEILPNESIPCIHMAMIDGFILNGEEEKLLELLNRKLAKEWSIVYWDSF